MGFSEAVSTVFSKYADFTGRAGRPEFWWFCLFVFAVAFVLGIASVVIGHGVGFLRFIFDLAVIVPSVAVGVRRLHDTDRSGWWCLISIIPIVGWIVYLVLQALPGTPGSNRFG